METYLINWLKERQKQLPLPTLTLTHIDIECESYNRLYTTCHFNKYALEVVFTKARDKVAVEKAQFHYAGLTYTIN